MCMEHTRKEGGVERSWQRVKVERKNFLEGRRLRWGLLPNDGSSKAKGARFYALVMRMYCDWWGFSVTVYELLKVPSSCEWGR